MKNSILIISAILLSSCSKHDNQSVRTKSDSTKIIESINVARTKMNDSIRLKNNRNIFRDLSGNHQLTFTSDENGSIKGNVKFENTGRDSYTISGKGKSGKNTLSIEGNIQRVSEKHLNFEGKIVQNINGNTFTRTKKTTFLDEGKGKFWRLQDKINGSGFVDYIDIWF